eukprot:CAMPEP_0116131270 /NCGR_PEP_ID=MMETSP0329-20121206/8918_1 /TAXON_ID=697910 /ORGANISM="Pseudo-nitzschia arenysensis, Strain B593" /LENGTH=97 /DNA_ID=CAMNT_0003625693 /DNA_START=174 /DNA_END=467 /DNA_ORIENTATION=+
MIRRSQLLLSKAGRTVVRDPRKAKARKTAVVSRDDALATTPDHLPQQQSPPQQQVNLPFQPSQQNQQSVGSTLVSYSLAGAGVAMGVTLVGALFGGF